MKQIAAVCCLLGILYACANNEPKYALESDGKRLARDDAERAHASAPIAMITGDVDTPPKVLSSKFPSYSQEWINANITGRVSVQFDIEIDGTVSNPTVIGSPPPELAAVTLHAIMQWKFAPAMKGGKPVRAKALQTFNFQTE